MPDLRRRDFLRTVGLVGGASVLVVGGRPGTTYAAADREIEQVTVYERGGDGYHTFRTPGVVQATDGTLLAFAGAHVNDPGDWGHVEMVLKRSSDGGRTWGPLQVVAADPPNKVANHVPVVDRLTGRIHLYVIRTAGHVVGDDIIHGRVSSEDAPRPHVTYSDDHGATWSEWREITADVKLPGMRHFVGGPGHGIQLTRGRHAGRLLLPGNHTVLPPDGDKPPVVGAHLIYSDDGGETWQVGAIDRHDDGMVHPNETTLVELSDGTVYVNTRDQRGSTPGHRAATTSGDGGTSFDAPFRIVPDLETPIVHGSLFELTRRTDPYERILFSAPGHPTSREQLTVWSSLDGAHSWRRSLLLYDGPSGYSDLVEVADGMLGVIYENGPRLAPPPYLTYHQRLTFARVPPQLLDVPAPPPSRTPDLSGRGNHATVSGSPRRIDGVFGRALELAGDYVEAPYAEPLAVGGGAFTAAVWFRTGEQRLQRILHAYNYEAYPQWLVEVSATRVHAQLRTDTSRRDVSVRGNLADGRWHHVALVRDDAAVRLYVDGSPVATAAPLTGSVSAGAIGGIRVGARLDGINNPLVGAVDEVFLFDRALTADQVGALAATNTAPAGTPLLQLPLEVVR